MLITNRALRVNKAKLEFPEKWGRSNQTTICGIYKKKTLDNFK